MRPLLDWLPLLAVLAPATGGLVAAGTNSPRSRRRVAVAASASTLGLVSVLFARAGASASLFSVAWVKSFGASFALGAGGESGTSAVLSLWISILSLVAILADDASGVDGERSQPRIDVPVLLGMEAALIGVFLARDLLLLLSFFGAGIACLAWLLSDGRERAPAYVVLQIVVFSGFVGLFAAGYEVVRAQTGFPSTDPARWQSIVLFPDAQRSVFSFALAFGVALLPLFPFALSIRASAARASLAARLLLYGGWSLVGGYLMVTFLVPALPSGASSLAPVALALGGISIVYAAVSSASTLAPLLAGYQGLFVVALFSFGAQGGVDARLWMMHAATSLAGLALATQTAPAGEKLSGHESNRSSNVALGLLFWMAAGAPGSIGFLALRETLGRAGETSAAKLAVVGGFALFAWAVLRRRRAVFTAATVAGSRRRTWLLLALVAASLAAGLHPDSWRERLRIEATSPSTSATATTTVTEADVE